MVTVISRPIGHKLGTTEIDAVISDYAGDAVVYVPGGHSLSDGDYIFIESNFDAYNGFKYVDSIAYDHFKLKESEGGDYVPFKQEADIIFYVSELEHGFQSVHLPIVYELESDLFPNNTIEESYTNRVVSFAADSNGYTGIQGSTDFTNVSDLDYIEFIGDGPLSGVYQILEVVDNDEIIINLAWDATNVFSGYELRKYYNNYFISVDVYVGLESDHRWSSEKPFELLATLKLIPDSTNRIKFSINEILKGQITTRNNLTLDQLPNNLDFYTQFYIEYAEVYDVSDGIDITSVAQDSVDDSVNFIGDAINSKYEFKSLNQSFASDYVDSENVLARWLTTQDRPIALVGYFFDLSFINRYNDYDIKVTIIKSLSGTTLDTDEINIINPGSGILRVPITPEDGYDEYCIQAAINSGDGFTPAVLQDFRTWTNINDAGPIWSLYAGSDPTYTGLPVSNTNSLGLNVTTDRWYTLYGFEVGRTYTFSYTFHEGPLGKTFTISVLDNAMGVLLSKDEVVFGDVSGTYTFVAPANATGISIHFFQGASCGSAGDFCKGFIVDFANETPSINPTMVYNITEQICIDIVSDCNTFINDDLRLTEGGVFRELE